MENKKRRQKKSGRGRKMGDGDGWWRLKASGEGLRMGGGAQKQALCG